MSLQSSMFKLGDVQGVRFDANFGDVLPMHDHSPSDCHFTIVARGSVRVTGPKIGQKEFRAGALLDFAPGSPHEFLALEDNTRWYQILKNVD